MKGTIEVTKEELVKLVNDYIASKLGIDSSKVQILTKSAQNYRSEWEIADFKAVIEIDTNVEDVEWRSSPF